MKKYFFLLMFFCAPFALMAQDQLLNVAKEYLRSGDFEKSAATFKQLLEYNSNDTEIMQGYFQSLIGLKDFKTAEKILKQQLKQTPKDPVANFELAKLYKEQGDEKKFKKQISKVIDEVEPNDQSVKNIASMFEKQGYFDYAIEVYEKGKSFQKGNPYAYAEELALIYDKKGNSEKAIESLLDLYISMPSKSEEIKATLQRMSEKPEKIEELRKKIQKRASKDEENIAFTDLLAWLYIQQNDYESAYLQIKSIDTRLNEQGRRILGFARVAFRENQFKAAVSAYDAVIDKGADKPFYILARSEKLTCLKEQLSNNPQYTKQDVSNVTNQYADFLNTYPVYKQKETLREYAELEARYANDIDKAISLLSEITTAHNIEPMFKGRCKLEMGDYELIRNNIWESTLLYSQVDKEFKQDMLGEEARFRNAKLSYYTGDFKWAQGQLDVLKASTSELIANDALNLSVLIIENNPPADSNITPLLMYARADLLEFQNKDEEANNTLDSIATVFPQHPLQDDILMTKARIAEKKHDYNEAAMYYQKIVTGYADDILADDALFNLASINEYFFSNTDEAKRLYEQLIIKYPGSTFINQARKRYRILRGDKPDVEDVKPF
jgi:tetratricopeptide (TPR) repeat protein